MTSSSKKIRTVCQGFHKEPTPERPTASVDPVWRPAALRPHRFRALVIFAAFTSRRWSELMALRVQDVDLDTGVVHVVRSC
jgi:integrase